MDINPVYENNQIVDGNQFPIIQNTPLNGTPKTKILVQNQADITSGEILVVAFSDDTPSQVGVMLPPLGVYSDEGDVYQGQILVNSLYGNDISVYGAYS